MTDTEPDKQANKIPRGALVVIAIGLIATLGVLALDWRGGGSSAELEWTTIEPIKTPAAAKVGRNGEFSMARTQLSAIGQNGGGESVFRVSGIVRFDTNGEKKPARIHCFVRATDPDSSISRTPGARGAWPRPTNDLDLKKQDVPESAVVKFNAVGNNILGLPMRDVINRYSDSAELVTADWDGFEPRTQNWLWKMPDGTGSSPASLGYVVIFKTPVKPEADLRCEATFEGKTVTQRAKAIQQEWPLPEPSLQSTEAEAEDATNVE